MDNLLEIIRHLFPSRQTKRKQKTQKRGKTIMFSESKRIRKSAISLLEKDLKTNEAHT